MEKRAFSIPYPILIFVMTFPQVILGDPRTQVQEQTCRYQPILNNTDYVSNFVVAMENISSQVRTQGYGQVITGQGTDAVYGLAQCYGDLSPVDCVLCYASARSILPQCYPNIAARLFLDGCFMRTANYSFFQEYAGAEDRVVCGNGTRKNFMFQEAARQAVLQATSLASNSSGYARAEMLVPGTRNESVYVLANCWRTVMMSGNSCRECLERASSSLLGCLPWSESRAMYAGCFMRYSNINFLNQIPSNSSSTGTRAVVTAVIVSSAVVVAGAAAVIGAYFWKHNRIEKKRKGSSNTKKLAKILDDSSLNFKYSILEKATAGFDEANKLGQGGFGTVYKGVLPDGREVAVKRLLFNSLRSEAEFYNEINIISSLQHKNLARLLGCSCSGPESLLVYEFLPNKSLDCFIFDSHKGKTLNWEKRFEIIIGTAEGLVYLHENTKLRIIHRDIKASNILLDARFRAKIADFGLARSFQGDNSHISTIVAGTLGYMAPEYISHGKLTEKTDVYSFGVLLLEIITGKQNNKCMTTSEYSVSRVTSAWKHFNQGTVEKLIDPNLMLHSHNNIGVKNEIVRVIHVGLLCTQEVPSLRPFMSEALQMLAKKDEILPPPTKPPFVYEEAIGLHHIFEKPSYPSIFENSNSVATFSQSIFYPR